MNFSAFFLCVAGLLSTLHIALGTKILAATAHFVGMEDAESGRAGEDPLSEFWIQGYPGVPLLPETISKLVPGTSFLIAKSSLGILFGEYSTELRDNLNGTFMSRSVYTAALKTQGISRKEAEYCVTYEALANASLIILEVEVEKDDRSELQFYHAKVIPKLQEHDNPLGVDKDVNQKVEFQVGDPFSPSPPTSLRIEINEKDRTKLDKIEAENRARIEKGFNGPTLQGVKVELRNSTDGIVCPGLNLYAYIVKMEPLNMGTIATAASYLSKKVKAKSPIRLAVGGPRNLVGIDGPVQYWLKYLYASGDGTMGAVFVDQLKV